LRVRHSGFGLAVTASTKLGSSTKFRWAGDYSRRHYQGAEVWNSVGRNQKNTAISRRFLERIVEDEQTRRVSLGTKDKSNFLLRTQDIDSIIQLLNDWESPQVEFSLISDTKNNLLTEYINSRRVELSEWDIFLPFSQKAKSKGKNIPPLPVGNHLSSEKWFNDLSKGSPFTSTTVFRQRTNARYTTTEDENGKQDTSRLLLTAKRQLSGNIMSDLTIGMAADQLNALAELESRKKQGEEDVQLSKEIFNRLERPILMIHFLQVDVPPADGDRDDCLDNSTPVVAVSIAFPGTNLEIREKEYLVNNVFLKQIEEMRQYVTSDEIIDE